MNDRQKIKLDETQNRIEQLLQFAIQMLQNNSESAKLDAEILLAFALKKSRTWLHTWPDKTINEVQLHTYQKMLELRHSGIPIAYITKQREFWLHTFEVSPEVLIPRPDTELLVEECLKIIPPDKPVKVLELGTGSGAISVSIGAERPIAQITATDISKPALVIASNNAQSAGVSNINFVFSHWFTHLPANNYDIIISNPPYVEQNDKHLYQGDVRFEPRLALTSGIDGLRDLRIIIDQAPMYLSNNAYIAVEHGYNQSDDVNSLLTDKQYFNIQIYKDLQANPRVTMAQFHSDNDFFMTIESTMHTNPIAISRTLINQMLHHAQLLPEIEVCGLIGALDQKPVSCYPIRNVAKNPSLRYEMDPGEQLAAIRHMQTVEEQLFAIYHSHPHSEALPSLTDIKMANYPEALYLIISLNTKGVLEIRGFRLQPELPAKEIVLHLEHE